MPRQQGKGNTELKHPQWLPHVKQQSCRNSCSEIGLRGEEEQETVINCTLSDHLSADSDKGDQSNSQNGRKVADMVYMPEQGVRSGSGDFAAPAMADCLEAELPFMNKNPASKVTTSGRPFQSSRVRQNSRRGGRFVRGYSKRTAWHISNGNPDFSVSNDVSASCVVSKTHRNHHSQGSEDDWEAAADALGLQLSLDGKGFHSPSANNDIIAEIGRLERLDCNQRALNTREDRFRSLNGKVWKPDGSNRQLPFRNPAKQQSLPTKPCRQIWIPVQKAPPPPRAPSHCPICIEELDTTDASFIPCKCSFQLCLFCYNRILSEDGRCPGCRKAYDKDMAMKLSSQNVLKRV